MTPLRAARVVGIALVGTLAEWVLIRRLGLVALIAPLVLLALLPPLLNPRIALGVLIAATILFESSSANILHFTTQQIHDPLPGHYGLLELLMFLAICSVVIDAIRGRRVPLRPAPFGLAIALLIFALLIGSIVGHYTGAGFNAITEEIRPVLPLIIVPWLTINAVRNQRDVRRGIALVGGLTVIKAVLGLLGVIAGVGVGADGSTITYYEPAANWLAMLYVLVILGSLVGRVRLRRLARWLAPLVLLSLVLSLRRSFWIGGVAAIPVLLVIAMPPIGRRLLIPATAILAVALWITIASGVVTESQTPIAQRINSLTPSRLTSNAEDRYRIDERKNVLAQIRASPLIGLGLAIPWQERYPLSVENPGARQYVHVAVLWYWLKFGVAGVLAYLAYMLTAVVVGIRVFRSHRDPLVRIAAAGAAAGIVGLMVVETTATFVGSDLRTTILVGFVAGMLSAALSQTPSGFAYTPALADPAPRPRHHSPRPPTRDRRPPERTAPASRVRQRQRQD